MNNCPDQDRPPIFIEVDGGLAELIPGFLANRAKDVSNLRAFVADDNLEAASRIAHSMKGSGGGYGFDTITSLGGKMEHAARAGDGAKVLALTDELEDFLARVRPVFS
jgi:HPt (histidine-containing phosphotransfer) domain-containing protein